MVFGWIVLSIVAGIIGNSRKIGFLSALFLSLLLSPLIGFLFVFNSEKKGEVTKMVPDLRRLINEGDLAVRKGNIDEAILAYTESLIYSVKAPYTNFKLSKLYSLKQDLASSLKHLTMAIDSGFKEFHIIKNDPDLAWLRNTKEFQDFVQNGYKSQVVEVSHKPALNKFDAIEKLGALYEKGMLSKEEFETEKKKILSSPE